MRRSRERARSSASTSAPAARTRRRSKRAAAHAAFDPASGRMTLTCTTQMPHLSRTAIADVLHLRNPICASWRPTSAAASARRCRCRAEYVLLVWLARKLRGTVAWSEDRRENLIAAFHSRDQHVQLEGAFDAAGKLIALSADVVANIGAYSCFPTTCGVEPLMAMAELPGPYDVARLCLRGARRRHPYLHHGALSRRVAPGHHLRHRAADGQGRRRVRSRSRRNPAAQSDQEISVHVRHRPRVRRRQLYRDPGAGDRACGPENFRAQQREARTRGRYRGIGFATFSERTGYGSPAFAARGMEITPGWETVEITMDPSGTVEARIGASPARPRAAHHAGPNHRRPGRRRAGAGAHRAWRHRPHALWLGHVRQPLAGHRRRRVAVGGTKDPQKTAHHRQPRVGGRGRRHRARRRRRQSFGNRSHGDDRGTGPRRLSSNPPVQGRDHAGLERKRRLRSARHLLQCLPRRHRRGRYRDRPASQSKNSSPWRMPAASSIR